MSESTSTDPETFTESDLKKKKLPELKEILRSRKLKISGNKAVLIARILGEDEEAAAVGSKRKRASSSSDGRTKKRKKSYRSFEGVEDEDFKNIKPGTARKELKKMVKTMHGMVDADWHDGYEEQGEYLQDYFGKVAEYGQSCYNASVVENGPKEQYERVNKTVLDIADSWENMQSIPARGVIEDDTFDSVISLSEIDEEQNYMGFGDYLVMLFTIAICGAASCEEFSDEDLNQLLKNMHDYTMVTPNIEDEEEVLSKHSCVEKSKERIKKLVESEDYKKCKSFHKKYKTKRVLDRRFDGPKHLRTRDFGSDDEGGCVIQ